MLLIISCLVSYNFEQKPMLGALDFLVVVLTFWLCCFFLFGPLPFAGMLFIAIYNSEKWFKFFLSFLLPLRNEAMVQWWLGSNVDDELWTSRERYCSFGDMTQAGSFCGELNLRKSFSHYILEFHTQIDSQTHLPNFFLIRNSVFFIFFLTKTTSPPPQHILQTKPQQKWW